MSQTRQKLRAKRKARSRSKLQGTAKRPRLVVFRSLRGVYAQLVDDNINKTIISAHKKDADKKIDASERAGKIDVAYQIGYALAQKANKKKIKEVIFDRSGYKYHGRVKALAEGARDGGLKF